MSLASAGPPPIGTARRSKRLLEQQRTTSAKGVVIAENEPQVQGSSSSAVVSGRGSMHKKRSATMEKELKVGKANSRALSVGFDDDDRQEASQKQVSPEFHHQPACTDCFVHSRGRDFFRRPRETIPSQVDHWHRRRHLIGVHRYLCVLFSSLTVTYGVLLDFKNRGIEPRSLSLIPPISTIEQLVFCFIHIVLFSELFLTVALRKHSRLRFMIQGPDVVRLGATMRIFRTITRLKKRGRGKSIRHRTELFHGAY